MRNRFAFAMAGAVVASAVAAQPVAPTFVTLDTDNDWFLHQDRHYTAGMQITFVKDIAGLPEGLRDLAPLRASADRMVALAIGQRVYTPGNTNPKPDEPLDRPYAGWFYLQADIRTQTGATVDHLLVNAGFIGPASGGKQVQRITHHIIGSRVFPGWDEQLKSEPTLMVSFERSWPALMKAGVGALRVDLSPYAAATVGTPYTYANAGLVARLGKNLPDDLPATQISLGTGRDGYRGAAQFGWYVWAGVDARAVGHNTFLDGSTFRDSPSVERKVFGLDAQFGVVVAWPWARAGLTLVHRAKEFEGQTGVDRFGQLSLSFSY
jgi:lipid A 3-O-deacylase